MRAPGPRLCAGNSAMDTFVEMAISDDDVALDELEDAAGTVVCERSRLDLLATRGPSQ